MHLRLRLNSLGKKLLAQFIRGTKYRVFRYMLANKLVSAKFLVVIYEFIWSKNVYKWINFLPDPKFSSKGEFLIKLELAFPKYIIY